MQDPNLTNEMIAYVVEILGGGGIKAYTCSRDVEIYDEMMGFHL